jgi:hypothetical protein
VRDPARVLRLSTATGLRELHKREAARAWVHPTRLRPITPEDIAVPLERAGDAEMDDMGRVVGQTQAQRWVWPVMDHRTGAVVASVVGRRQDEDCGRWQARRLGARTRVIAMLKSPLRASATRRPSSANSGRGGRG